MEDQHFIGTLPAGSYYIGDLIYVAGDADFKKVYAKIKNDRKENGIYLTTQGIKCGCFVASSRYQYEMGHEGDFVDQHGHKYPFETRLITCYPAGDGVIPPDQKRVKTTGRVVDFPEPFKISSHDGGSKMTFGHIELSMVIPEGLEEEEHEPRPETPEGFTDEEEEEDEEDEEEEEEEEEEDDK